MVNNTWILIYKKLNNTATADELEEIERILKEDAGVQYPVTLLEHLWNTYPVNKAPDRGPNEQQWSVLQARLNKTPDDPLQTEVQQAKKPKQSQKHSLRKYLVSAAAAALILCGSLALFYQKPEGNKNGICEIKVPMGGMTNVQLPDGSTIILNAGSKLTYKNTFDARHREITLSGEAFFDVVKDPAHPFVITTPTIKIRVLGTRFNVRSYPGDKTSEASLFRGIIELTVLKNPDRQIILKPSEKLTLINPLEGNKKSARPGNADTMANPVIELSTIHRTAKDTLPSEAVWTRNRIIFDGMEFQEVAKMMERKYDTRIIFKREELKGIILTGSFENLSLDKALQQLKLINHFNYMIINNQVFID